jgi:myo-inositol 2-dehydrogenase/D-chiro-inositol 1-dehydrogenase
MRQTLGVVLLGAGRIGRLHAATLGGLPTVRVVAVVDPDRAAAEAARTLARAEQATDDVARTLDHPAVEAVVIATPTETHADLIVAAARRRLAVFCEKPVALTLAETRRALQVVAEMGVPFQIGFQRRFDPGYQRARALLEEGAIGPVEMFRAVGRDPFPPPFRYLATSGGMFVDMAIHDYDLARFLVGEVLTVQAWGAVLVDPGFYAVGDVDTSLTVLRFANGALGVVENSRRAVYGYDIRTEVFGARGKIVVEALPRTPLWQFGSTGLQADHYRFFADRFQEAYRRELAAFVQAVQGGQPPRPGPRDALEALRIALAATRSHREGRPVDLWEVE